MPSYLKSKLYVDFRNNQAFSENMDELLRDLHNLPRFSRPPLGPKPLYSSLKSDRDMIHKNITYCRRCGATPGQNSECTGFYSSHDFTTGSGVIYCQRCGIFPKQQSECTGLYTFHDFVST